MTPAEALVAVMQEHPSRDALDLHIMRCETEGKVAALVPITETVNILREMLSAGQLDAKVRMGKLHYTLKERTVQPGWRPEVVHELEDDEPEKMYLVHECGEAFDDMQAAVDHECNLDTDSYYQIKPESEAM
jgi:hypothetical protein